MRRKQRCPTYIHEIIVWIIFTGNLFDLVFTSQSTAMIMTGYCLYLKGLLSMTPKMSFEYNNPRIQLRCIYMDGLTKYVSGQAQAFFAV